MICLNSTVFRLWSGSVKHPGLDLNTWFCLVNNIQWFIDHRQQYEMCCGNVYVHMTRKHFNTSLVCRNVKLQHIILVTRVVNKKSWFPSCSSEAPSSTVTACISLWTMRYRNLIRACCNNPEWTLTQLNEIKQTRYNQRASQLLEGGLCQLLFSQTEIKVLSFFSSNCWKKNKCIL